MAVEQRNVVEREVRIAAQPETVFAFFIDPEKMILWKGRRAELDARPGGVYRVEINDQAVARGEYVEIDAPKRVVFTWGWEGQEQGEGAHAAVPPGTSRVEISLEPDGDGTRVTIVENPIGIPAHVVAPPLDLVLRGRNEEGLNRLKKLAEERFHGSPARDASPRGRAAGGGATSSRSAV